MTTKSFCNIAWKAMLCFAACWPVMYLLTGCGSAGHFAAGVTPDAPSVLMMKGNVHGGQQPVSGATIQLYAAGSGGASDGLAATPLISGAPVLTGPDGGFTITSRYTCPSSDTQVYLVATGGNPGMSDGTNNSALAMMAALGPCGNLTPNTFIFMNEATTVSSVAALTPFMSAYDAVGSTPADAEAMVEDFALVNTLVNTTTGNAPGPITPVGFSVDQAKIYALSNVVAACINSAGGASGDGTACGWLFQYATPPGGTAPQNTVDALRNIAKFPTQNVASIFGLGTATGPFQPTLASAPADWNLLPQPTITLTPAIYPVGVGHSIAGTLTLGRAPQNDLTVALSSSQTTHITVDATVTVPAGQTTATFNYTGVTSGASTLNATAGGYLSGSVNVNATDQVISLGSVANLTPGQTAGIPLSIPDVAPAGGITVSLLSTNTSVATVSPTTVVIPAGAKIPTSNPIVTAAGAGTAQIIATANGYSQGTSPITVAVTATLNPAAPTIAAGLTNATLSLSGPAPAGGITFTLQSSNTGVLTVPTTVMIAAGTTSVTVPLTGVGSGTSTLTISSAVTNTLTPTVTVNTAIDSGQVKTGVNLMAQGYFQLHLAPSSAQTVTVTSNDPTIATVSANTATVGTPSVTVANVNDAGARYFQVQGQKLGSTTLTISAPGYTPVTVPVVVQPSGFLLTGGDLSTTTFSGTTTRYIYANLLDNSLNPAGALALNPGLSVSVPVTSSDTSVGTVTNPVIVAGGTTNSSVTFTPVGNGTTKVSIATPTGFSTPTSSTSFQATVTQPTISTGFASTGVFLMNSFAFNLSATPPAPVTVTIQNDNPTVLQLSFNNMVMGTGSTVTLPNVSDYFTKVLYLQGLQEGTATLTISAPGYATATVPVTVKPSGLVMSGDFSTTTFSAPTSKGIIAYPLDPTTHNPGNATPLNPGTSVSVSLTSSNPAVGTVTSPVTLLGGSNNTSTNFTPGSTPGKTTVSIVQPPGWTTPLVASSFTATVTAPGITASSQVNTGVNLMAMANFSLDAVPPSAVAVTVSSSNPAVATVSLDNATVGTASITFANLQDYFSHVFYVQGQSQGTATITVSAPGYTMATFVATVHPSGFVISTNDFSTTTFSGTSGISVFSAYLDASMKSVLSLPLNPGVSVSVPLTSSNTAAGTVISPVTVNGGSSNASATFNPLAAGTTTVSVGTPAGFTAPADHNAVNVTVSAPTITVYGGSTPKAGASGTSYTIGLSVAPPSPVTVTVSSNAPGVVLLSTTPGGPGQTSLTFTNINNTSGIGFYLVGVAPGTTTLTISAAGYQTANPPVTVSP